ncbi:phosphotransferase [Arthrobacter sp. CG_A4]|uniref:phosphotransferase n=1 Tax=Arthrobacter sp. CG_A4 TaxID=3071706 RepID=UPI002DFB1163|nr:Ser/Thr protein kinase RdoA (MazF antagonist) [Arthrobacter sp. CG_A4]
MDDEETLAGGNSTLVTRLGQTVRRSSGPWTPAVHTFLDTLRAAGITEVPEVLGMDAHGREVLTFIPGDAAHYPLPDWVWEPSILHDAGALLRRIHDAGVGLALADLEWQIPTHQPPEVVCHNDTAPYNMVFRDGRLAALIDVDTASPGPRIWDFAYLAYRLVPLGENGGATAPGVSDRVARLDALITAYGLPFDHRDVFKTLAVRLDELADFTDYRAAATGRTDFLDHSAMYRRDRDKVSAQAVWNPDGCIEAS